MKPILYPAGETEFRNNGLGRLSEATKCLVTEERNGQYELEMQYPITGRHYKEIVEERIIAARHDDTDDIQPFRIYKITRPMNGIVTISDRPISYQLSKVAVMKKVHGIQRYLPDENIAEQRKLLSAGGGIPQYQRNASRN